MNAPLFTRARRALAAAVDYAAGIFRRRNTQRVEMKLMSRDEMRAMQDRERERHQAIKQWTADHVGVSFVDVPDRPIAAGYFWKRDQGALDGVGRPGLWRIYRRHPRPWERL
jgi:hypothetical protein